MGVPRHGTSVADTFVARSPRSREYSQEIFRNPDSAEPRSRNQAVLHPLSSPVESSADSPALKGRNRSQVLRCFCCFCCFCCFPSAIMAHLCHLARLASNSQLSKRRHETARKTVAVFASTGNWEGRRAPPLTQILRRVGATMVVS